MRMLLAAALFALAVAPARPAPRDFSGVWNYATMTPLERPSAFAEREALTPDEAARYEQQTIQRQENTNNTAGPDWWDPGTRHLTNRRTSLIVDPPNGRLPPLTPAAQAKAAARAQARRQRALPDGPEDLALNERCLSWAVAGPPMLPGVYNNNVEFVITNDAVVIHNEMIHEARIVPMDGRPHGTLRRWMGDSRGRWDGATLVVDTIGFLPQVSVRGSDEALHLVERFTRLDADTIDYQITMDDPTVWTSTWTARFPMHRVGDRIYEYACHEGNFRSVQGVLLGARAQEREPHD
ncbi:MAG TPA: hypothetical protein VFA27_09770 [Vicinamibacterales bacterium]|nr:hypothetical protein [Vicinamibacterales bacterium]